MSVSADFTTFPEPGEVMLLNSETLSVDGMCFFEDAVSISSGY